jgi:hypothetical protein
MEAVLANLYMLFPGRTPSDWVKRLLEGKRKETLQELLVYRGSEEGLYKVWAIYQRSPTYIGSYFTIQVTKDKILMYHLESI